LLEFTAAKLVLEFCVDVRAKLMGVIAPLTRNTLVVHHVKVIAPAAI
jgi:hypothetical protein